MRYEPRWIDGGARPRGWYVVDLSRTTPSAVVVVGGRHLTRIEAQSEGRRLEMGLC